MPHFAIPALCFVGLIALVAAAEPLPPTVPVPTLSVPTLAAERLIFEVTDSEVLNAVQAGA